MGQDDQYLLPRQLDLSEITCYGFDMDYTLCEYRAPAMDSLAHTLAKEFIVNRWTAHSCLLPLSTSSVRDICYKCSDTCEC